MRTKTKYRAVCNRCDRVLSKWRNRHQSAKVEEGAIRTRSNHLTDEVVWVCKGCQ